MSFTMSSNPNTIKKLSESGFDFLNLSHPEIFKIISFVGKRSHSSLF